MDRIWPVKLDRSDSERFRRHGCKRCTTDDAREVPMHEDSIHYVRASGPNSMFPPFASALMMPLLALGLTYLIGYQILIVFRVPCLVRVLLYPTLCMKPSTSSTQKRRCGEMIIHPKGLCALAFLILLLLPSLEPSSMGRGEASNKGVFFAGPGGRRMWTVINRPAY